MPDAAEPEATPGRPARLLAVGRRLMPWLSLAIAVGGALLMDRSPEKAARIAAASVGSWGLLLLLPLAQRLEAGDSARRATFVRLARFSSLAATQWLIQMSLFFALPFYLRAATWHPGHVGFVVLLVAAALLTLWDPLCQALLLRPALGLPLAALSSFAAANATLPILGLSNRASLYLAAGGTILLVPLHATLTAGAGRRLRHGAIGLGAALTLGLALWLGAARAIPAAPLRLVAQAIGTRLGNRDVIDPRPAVDGVPAQLVCATSIWAPRGLHDALQHAWRHDGDVVDRIPLPVSGGRDQGYRTWSIKRTFGRSPGGRWTCSVETASGQLLGERAIDVRVRQGRDDR